MDPQPHIIGAKIKLQAQSFFRAEKAKKRKVLAKLENGELCMPTKLHTENKSEILRKMYNRVDYFVTTSPIKVEEVTTYVPNALKNDTTGFGPRPDLLVGIGECNYVLCHRIVLLSSDYFANQIKISCEKYPHEPIIAIECKNLTDELKRESLLAVITFLYTGKIKTDKRNFRQFYQLSEVLKIPSLARYLANEKFYQINVDQNPHIGKQYNYQRLEPKLRHRLINPKQKTGPKVCTRESVEQAILEARNFLQRN